MNQSIMAMEARQVPQVIQAQLHNNASAVEALVGKLKSLNPRLIYMIGRGSSDHAGVYAKYLFEVEMAIPVCSAALSIAGVYGQSLQLDGAVAFVISQSGRSPDILRQAESAKKGGAYTVAFVNDETSPLATLADAVIPISAGEEKAVAATKSYLATLSALAHVCAVWKQDDTLLNGLNCLPDALSAIISQPAQLESAFIENTRNAIVLGRGFGYAIGREIALKLKEVLGVHAEAFSSAEFIHGPVTLVERKLKILALEIDDESASFHHDIILDVTRRGAECLTLRSTEHSVHKRLQPLLVMLRFYLDVEAVAVAMGLDPDTPPGLNKVTKTQ